MRTMSWSLVDHSTISGHGIVCTTLGNCSLLSMYNIYSQELAACRRLGFSLLVEKGLAPSLVKEIVLFESVQTGLVYVSHIIKRYQVTGPILPLRVYEPLSLSDHRAYRAYSLSPHTCRCKGDGKVF